MIRTDNVGIFGVRSSDSSSTLKFSSCHHEDLASCRPGFFSNSTERLCKGLTTPNDLNPATSVPFLNTSRLTCFRAIATHRCSSKMGKKKVLPTKAYPLFLYTTHLDPLFFMALNTGVLPLTAILLRAHATCLYHNPSLAVSPELHPSFKQDTSGT